MTSYAVCRNCGAYAQLTLLVGRAFCSEECARRYSTCPVCGKAFPKGKGFDGEHCSRECTTRYLITRTYGPEPVTVVTEV